MLHAWRWFGPDDPVRLSAAAQAGATGIVTALHELPIGVEWPVERIRERLRRVRKATPGWPLEWVVVESVPVHDAIKTRGRDRERYLEAYARTLRNLARCGIRTVCYNFMPVVDWTRTDIAYPMPDGSTALRFDPVDLAMFDLFILQREGEGHYEAGVVARARDRFERSTTAERDALSSTILAGLPGSEESHTVDSFRRALARYAEIDVSDLRANLIEFLEYVVPIAAEVGVRLAIHPDDPPFPLLGLPRCVSTESDLEALLAAVDDPSNGLTLCTGSLGARPDNDVVGMARRFAGRTHFAHLRNVRLEGGGAFHESDHLDGSIDMVEVVRVLLDEEARRADSGSERPEIPMRPDHGHRMLEDLTKTVNPGYSAIGRLRGLAELRGLERGLLDRERKQEEID